MHPNDKAALQGFLNEIEEQCEGWELALDKAQNLMSDLIAVDTTSIYAVQWDQPDGMGGISWDYSRDVAEAYYGAFLLQLEGVNGAHVRLYKIDAVETITCAVEGEILALDDMDATDSLPAGYEIVKRETVAVSGLENKSEEYWAGKTDLVTKLAKATEREEAYVVEELSYIAGDHAEVSDAYVLETFAAEHEVTL